MQWFDDTFYFLDNSSGRGRYCEITTHDFDSLEEMYNSFQKAVIVDSEPRWKPSEEQIRSLEYFVKLWGNTDEQIEYVKIFNDVKSILGDLKKL